MWTLFISFSWLHSYCLTPDIYTQIIYSQGININSFHHITSYYVLQYITHSNNIFYMLYLNLYIHSGPTFLKHIDCKNHILEVPKVLVLTPQHRKSFTSSSADNFHFHPGLTVTISHFPHGRGVSGLGLEGSLFPQTIPHNLFPRWAF